MRVLWLIWLVASVSVVRTAVLSTYNDIPFRNEAQYAQIDENSRTDIQGSVATHSARNSAAVYRQPLLNRNGVISRNPDAVWNDPVESSDPYPTPVAGAEFVVYGDPGYGAYQGTFGGLAAYSYKAKRASSKKA